MRTVRKSREPVWQTKKKEEGAEENREGVHCEMQLTEVGVSKT